jgi:hypothetical protein
MSDDEYLFDKTGAPDPEVAKLERALRPVGRGDDAPVVFEDAPRRPTPWIFGLAAAAAACLVVTASLFFFPTVAPFPPRPNTTTAIPPSSSGPTIQDATADASFAVGEWVETKDAEREILVGDLGRVTLAAQSRLQVKHVSDEETRLYLERGSLEAFVSAGARPRFFQVDTDAVRCVDLGCRYTLEVADDGDAKVRVVTGQVAFEDGKREVFVPAGAVCVAKKGRGSGTPRFEDAPPAVAKAFDAYDAASPDDRPKLAAAALQTVRDDRDTLPAWHLLQDADAETARAAAARLELVAGKIDFGADVSEAGYRNAWKERLAAKCW